jgi:hypothetical protein
VTLSCFGPFGGGGCQALLALIANCRIHRRHQQIVKIREDLEGATQGGRT